MKLKARLPKKTRLEIASYLRERAQNRRDDDWMEEAVYVYEIIKEAQIRGDLTPYRKPVKQEYKCVYQNDEVVKWT